jgi:hypothetical protein
VFGSIFCEEMCCAYCQHTNGKSFFFFYIHVNTIIHNIVIFSSFRVFMCDCFSCSEFCGHENRDLDIEAEEIPQGDSFDFMMEPAPEAQTEGATDSDSKEVRPHCPQSWDISFRNLCLLDSGWDIAELSKQHVSVLCTDMTQVSYCVILCPRHSISTYKGTLTLRTGRKCPLFRGVLISGCKQL